MNIRYRDISKVLPLVYDDTLSYYEVLCKVKEKLNEVIDLDNAQSVAINGLGESSAERYNQFEQKILDDLATMETTLEGKIVEGDDYVMETLSALIASLSDDLADAVASVDAMSSTVDEIGGTVQELSEEVSTISDTVDTLSDNVGDIVTEVSGIQSTVSDLSSSVSGLGSEISGITSDVEALDGRVDDIEETLEGFVFADVDDALSTTSVNPVENRAVTTAINNLGDEIDNLSINDLSDVNITSPTAGQVLVFDSNGNVVNGNAPASITVDSSLSDSSTNPVENRVITGKIAELNDYTGFIRDSIWEDTLTEGEVLQTPIGAGIYTLITPNDVARSVMCNNLPAGTTIHLNVNCFEVTLSTIITQTALEGQRTTNRLLQVQDQFNTDWETLGSTSMRSHSVGDYLTLIDNGSVYVCEVTAPISVGDTISFSTNIDVAPPVYDVIKTLSQSTGGSVIKSIQIIETTYYSGQNYDNMPSAETRNFTINSTDPTKTIILGENVGSSVISRGTSGTNVYVIKRQTAKQTSATTITEYSSIVNNVYSSSVNYVTNFVACLYYVVEFN